MQFEFLSGESKNTSMEEGGICCGAGYVVGGRGEWGTLLEASNWTTGANLVSVGTYFFLYTVWLMIPNLWG